MKLKRNVRITATYRGVVPEDELFGSRKYKGYVHLFEDVDGPTFSYSISRAAVIPKELKKGVRYTFKCNWRSSIITSINGVSVKTYR